MTSGLRQAVSFLTPLAGAATPSPAALSWFPVVGASIGLSLGGGWALADRLVPRLVAAALVVTADLALTGLLHLDGLVDASDGLLPHLTAERRLEVMALPDAGGFGVGVAVVTLLLRWSAVAVLVPAPLVLAGLWCLSRTAMAAGALLLPYARTTGGLAAAFRSPSGDGARTGARADAGDSRRGLLLAVGGLLLSLLLAMAWEPVPGAASIAAAAVASAAVLALARRRIGGFTGDVLGAAGMVGETVGLVVAAGRW